jgi:hypothetical protein
MIAYEFYFRDEMKGDRLVGILPERRENRERITDESILKWVENLLGDHQDMDHIYVVKVTLD